MRLPSRRTVLAAFGLATAGGLILFGYRWLDVAARGRVEPFQTKFIEEMSSAYGILLLVPFVAWWTRRVRERAASAAGSIALHAAALIPFSLLHTSWNAVARHIAFAAAGLGRYDYGILPVRYVMEFSIHIVLYIVIVACVSLLDHTRQLRERGTRLARTEAELHAARLHALESRLHPHFLFNALNTVSSLMYEDVQAADRMIARLGDLLRRALRDTSPEVPLHDEMETTALWVDMMRARFGDRLEVTIDAAEPVRAALVPPLLLQPLLENAVEHGDPGPGRTARIALRAVRAGNRLLLEVADNGPGLTIDATDALSRGVGLSTTRRRLEVLYDGAHGMTVRNREGGGVVVSISMPFREA
jgi:two-component system, LytTR family, sensor kinase